MNEEKELIIVFYRCPHCFMLWEDTALEEDIPPLLDKQCEKCRDLLKNGPTSLKDRLHRIADVFYQTRASDFGKIFELLLEYIEKKK